MPLHKHQTTIVFLDSYTLNPGDLDWQAVKHLGELIIYERTPPELVVERSKNATIIVANKSQLTTEVLAQLPHLQFIAVSATGYNNVDLSAARKRGIAVSNAPVYGPDSVAQHTFALLLELTNRVGQHAISVANGEWEKSVDWCYWKQPIMELWQKTIGIVGLGSIGERVARIALAFGMKVVAHNRSPKKMEGVKMLPLEQLFQESDVVSLHLPLTKENTAFVNAALLSKMKETALLINTARGALIQETDLAYFLKEKRIAGAALDVLSVEPPTLGNPLIGIDNCIITPHNAWGSQEARNRLLHIVADNIEGFLNGRLQNVVN